MSEHATYCCDGPDCPHTWESFDCPGLLSVSESGASIARHFCSWDCCMKFAATIPPPERIEIGTE